MGAELENKVEHVEDEKNNCRSVGQDEDVALRVFLRLREDGV